MEFSDLSIEERYDAYQKMYVYPTDIAGNTIHVTIPKPEPEPVQDDITVCICGGKYSHFNKNRHYNTKKHRNAILSLQNQLPTVLVREQQVNSSP
jgi:hypothetical protein